MKLTYNPDLNIAYIRFAEKSGKVSTIRVCDDLNVDIAPDGTVYGIEFLNADAQLFGNGGELELINQALGKSIKVTLPT